jgi:hypothetical protein
VLAPGLLAIQRFDHLVGARSLVDVFLCEKRLLPQGLALGSALSFVGGLTVDVRG